MNFSLCETKLCFNEREKGRKRKKKRKKSYYELETRVRMLYYGSKIAS